MLASYTWSLEPTERRIYLLIKEVPGRDFLLQYCHFPMVPDFKLPFHTRSQEFANTQIVAFSFHRGHCWIRILGVLDNAESKKFCISYFQSAKDIQGHWNFWNTTQWLCGGLAYIFVQIWIQPKISMRIWIQIYARTELRQPKIQHKKSFKNFYCF